MLSEIFSSGALNLVYFAVLLISFLFALVTLIGAEIGDVLDFDVDGDAGADFISISPFALALFGAIFGLVGLITRIWYEMDPIPSVMWAAGIGLVFGIAAQAFFYYVLSPSTSSHYSLERDVVGRDAQVVTTIPANGRGEIVVESAGGQLKLGARSASDEEIPYGSIVVIERMVGRVAQVRISESS